VDGERATIAGADARPHLDPAEALEVREVERHALPGAEPDGLDAHAGDPGARLQIPHGIAHPGRPSRHGAALLPGAVLHAELLRPPRFVQRPEADDEVHLVHIDVRKLGGPIPEPHILRQHLQ